MYGQYDNDTDVRYAVRCLSYDDILYLFLRLIMRPGAAERLSLHSADLGTAGAFDAVLEGATACLHTAVSEHADPSALSPSLPPPQH